MASDLQDVLDTGWVERSHRAAAALIAQSPLTTITADDYNRLEAIIAQAWRDGHLDGLDRALTAAKGSL